MGAVTQPHLGCGKLASSNLAYPTILIYNNLCYNLQIYFTFNKVFHGVMVAQQILVLLVRVRILVKQQHYHFLQMKTLQEFLKESLLQHIALELKDEDIIYERYGVYDGCNELINFIINKIDKDENLIIQYNEVKHLKNIVFDVLHINLTKSSFSNDISSLQAPSAPLEVRIVK